MKYFYIAVQRTIKTGYYAYYIRVSDHDNLASKMADFHAANICPTKRRAQEISAAWNDSFIANGNYAFMQPETDPETDPDEMLLPF